MLVLVAIVWLGLAFGVGAMGAQRTIGGFAAGALSFFLSPVIGLLFVLCSKYKEEENPVKSAGSSAEKMAAAVDSLKKGKELLQEGLIDEAAFERLKAQCEQVLHGLDDKEAEQAVEKEAQPVNRQVENPYDPNALTPQQERKNIIGFLIAVVFITVCILAVAFSM